MTQPLSSAETHFSEFYNKINLVADYKLFRDTNGTDVNKLNEFSSKDYKINPIDTFILIKDITSIHTKKYDAIDKIPGKSFTIGKVGSGTTNVVTITNTFSYQLGSQPTYFDPSLCNIFKYDISNSPHIDDLHFIYTNTEITEKIKKLFTYKTGTNTKYVWNSREDMLFLFQKPILLTFDMYNCNKLTKYLFDASFHITDISPPSLTVEDLSTLAQFNGMKPTFFTLLIYYAGYNFGITTDAIKNIYRSKFESDETFTIQQYVPPTNESIFIHEKSITPIIPNNINLKIETLELFHVGQIDSLWDYVNGKLTILIYNMLKHPTEKGIYEKMFKTSYASNNLFLLECIEALENYKKYITSAEVIKTIAFPRSTIKTIEILLVKLSYILSKLESSFIPSDTVTFNVKVKDTTFTYVVNSQNKVTKTETITTTGEVAKKLLDLQDMFTKQTTKIDTLTNNVAAVTTKINEVKTEVQKLPTTITTNAGAGAVAIASGSSPPSLAVAGSSPPSLASGSSTPLAVASGSSTTPVAVAPIAVSTNVITMPKDLSNAIIPPINIKIGRLQTISDNNTLETSYNLILDVTKWGKLINDALVSPIGLSFESLKVLALNKIWSDTSDTQVALANAAQAFKEADDKVKNFKSQGMIAKITSVASQSKSETKNDLIAKKDAFGNAFLYTKHAAETKVNKYMLDSQTKVTHYLLDLSNKLINKNTAASSMFGDGGVAIKELEAHKYKIFTTEIDRIVATALYNYDLSFTVAGVGGITDPIPNVGTPINVRGIAGCRKVTVTWDAPTNGKTTLANYIVKENNGQARDKTVKASLTSATIGDLSNNKTYSFAVYAINKANQESSGAAFVNITPTIEDCSFTKETKQNILDNTTIEVKKLTIVLDFDYIKPPFKNYKDYTKFCNSFPDSTDDFFIKQKFKNEGKSKKIISEAIDDVMQDNSKNHFIMQEALLDKNDTIFNTTRKSTLTDLSNYKVERNKELKYAIENELWTGTNHNSSIIEKIIKIESKYWSAWNLYKFYMEYGISEGITYPPLREVSGVGLDKSVRINWKAPIDTNGHTTAYYTVSGELGYYTLRGEPKGVLNSGNPNHEAKLSYDISNITIKDLTNGKPYSFTVSIFYDDGGTGGALSTIIVPFDKPNSITGLSGEAYDRQVKLKWTEPSNNGAPITGYKLKQSIPGTSSSDIISDVSYGKIEHTVAGLTNATAYNFSLAATNKAGDSNFSNEVSLTPQAGLGDPKIKLEKPPQITGVSGEAGLKNAKISWTLPLTVVNPPITKYNVVDISHGKNQEIIGSTISGATISSLTPGANYNFVVTATNSIGTSISSDSVTITPIDYPYAPRDLSGTAHCGYVKLNWIEPSYNGFSPITDYTVKNTPASRTDISITDLRSDASYTYIIDLSNDISYTFQVFANNKLGRGVSAEIILRPTYNDCSFMIQTKRNTITNTEMSNNVNIAKAILELSNIELSFNTNIWETIFNDLSLVTISELVNDSSKNAAFDKLGHSQYLNNIQQAIIDASSTLFTEKTEAAIIDLSNSIIPNIEANFNALHVDICKNNIHFSTTSAKPLTSSWIGFGSYDQATKDKETQDIQVKINTNKINMLNEKIKLQLAQALRDTYIDASFNTYYTDYNTMIEGISKEKLNTLKTTEEEEKLAAAAPAPAPVKKGFAARAPRLAKYLGYGGGSITRKKTLSSNKSKTKKNKELKAKLKSELKSEFKTKTESKTKIRAISKTRKIMNKN